MKVRTISQLVAFVAVAIALANTSLTKTATAGFFGKLLDQTGCCQRCPACDHVCKLDAEKVDEDKPCFDVESKVICIPRVVFPWQKKDCSSCRSCDGNGCSNCVNNGARTRKICVLKPSSYKCPKCKYTWSAEKKEGCDRGCAAGNCACDAVPTSYPPTPAPEPRAVQTPTPIGYGQPVAAPTPVVETLPPPAQYVPAQ